MVINVMASVEYNPFTTSPKNLINIATGQHADSEVEQNLINIKDIGHQALTKSITYPGPKTKIVRLKTFKTQHKIKNKAKPSAHSQGKSSSTHSVDTNHC